MKLSIYDVNSEERFYISPFSLVRRMPKIWVLYAAGMLRIFIRVVVLLQHDYVK